MSLSAGYFGRRHVSHFAPSIQLLLQLMPELVVIKRFVRRSVW